MLMYNTADTEDACINEFFCSTPRGLLL